jgi:uncharacterized protein (DUF1330 family)
MSAYWLARVSVNNPEQFGEYVKRVPQIIADHGGTYLAKGQALVVEGETSFQRFVVILFPSFEDAVACHSSDAYQSASKLREGAGEVEIVIVDAVASVG